MIIWKNMLPSHLQQVLQIADTVHVDYPESLDVFAERLDLFPQGCWVAMSSDAAILGYAIMHPSVVGQPPSLDSLLGTVSETADCLYIHDVAILPAARAHGLGRQIVSIAGEIAQQTLLHQLALVAVNQSAPYWQRHGFTCHGTDNPILQKKLQSYSDDAQYMLMHLS